MNTNNTTTEYAIKKSSEEAVDENIAYSEREDSLKKVMKSTVEQLNDTISAATNSKEELVIRKNMI